MDENPAKAASFRKMHEAPPILILPNAWDAVSARLFVKAGARAIATTSAGIAATLGYPDGQKVPRGLMMEAVSRIAHAVDVPVTADIEAGYATSALGLGDTIRALIAAGAVGCNPEDATGEPSHPLFEIEEQVERIRTARETAEGAGVSVVINARTDVYLASVGEPGGRFAETMRRANAYRSAGADCIFVPGVADLQMLAELARQIAAPLNVLAGPGVPAASELERIGVARLSAGSSIMRATLGLARDAAKALLEEGSCARFLARAVPYSEINELMK